jgi:hypothetical protein
LLVQWHVQADPFWEAERLWLLKEAEDRQRKERSMQTTVTKWAQNTVKKPKTVETPEKLKTVEKQEPMSVEKVWKKTVEIKKIHELEETVETQKFVDTTVEKQETETVEKPKKTVEKPKTTVEKPKKETVEKKQTVEKPKKTVEKKQTVGKPKKTVEKKHEETVEKLDYQGSYKKLPVKGSCTQLAPTYISSAYSNRLLLLELIIGPAYIKQLQIL